MNIRRIIGAGVAAAVVLVVGRMVVHFHGYQPQLPASNRTSPLPLSPAASAAAPVGVLRSSGRGGPDVPGMGPPSSSANHRDLSQPADEDAGPDAVRARRVLAFADEAQAREAERLARDAGLYVRRVGHRVMVMAVDRSRLDNLWGRGMQPRSEGFDHRIYPPPDEISREPPPGVTYVGVGSLLPQVLRLGVDNSTWGQGVRVAVIDGGVAFAALPASAAGPSIDLVGGKADLSHGTEVASQITGGSQSFGVAPAAIVMSARVIDAEGTGSSFLTAEAVLWAIEQEADVINLSLSSRGDSPAMREAIAAAAEAGIVVVAAAGNEGTDRVSYPAAYDGVISVGATDAMGQHLYFSNSGEVDLVAPGASVAATGPNGDLALVSGTSVAAPQVAGAAAGLLSGDPAATPQEVEEALTRSAADTGLPGNDSAFGAGILDLGALVQQGNPGVVDVSVASPYARNVPGGTADIELVAFAQNRGSVSVPVLDLRVTADGRLRESTHYNVAPGQTVSMEWRVPVPSGADVLAVSVEAFAREGQDRRPEDNRIAVMLRRPSSD